MTRAAREGRGWFGTWPRRAGVLAAVGGALVAVVVIVNSVAARPPHHFPGQYAFSGLFFFPTVVSVAQAFHDHGLVPPPDIRDLRYSADSQAVSSPYPYPFDAVFVIPCTEVSGFVRENNLRYGGSGSDWPSPDVDVLLFAQALGWHSSDRLAHWYYNTEVYQDTEMVDDYQELMITGRTACTVYLWN
jgi:hypothetical protein